MNCTNFENVGKWIMNLQEKGIEATIKLSESPNSKVIVIGTGQEGMPIILGGNN